jgi:hypothetical protein
MSEERTYKDWWEELPADEQKKHISPEEMVKRLTEQIKQPTLDDVLYKWACDCIIPLGGEPSNEIEVRRVNDMMTRGVKLLQLAQSPAYQTFRLQEIIDRVEELVAVWNEGKPELYIGMRMDVIARMIRDLKPKLPTKL